MSPQLELLDNLIQAAEKGHPEAVKLLREIVVAAAEAAPAEDLILLAKELLEIGKIAVPLEAPKP